MIEIMPSRVPDFLKQLSTVSPIPIITGGLLTSPYHAKEALENGATAVTTSNTEFWKLNVNDFYGDSLQQVNKLLIN